MTDVTIYVTPICPYCVRAKALFDKLGLAYKTIDVSATPDLRQEMMERSGGALLFRKFLLTAPILAVVMIYTRCIMRAG